MDNIIIKSWPEHIYLQACDDGLVFKTSAESTCCKDVYFRSDIVVALRARIAEMEARQVPELGSGIVNECGWRFIEAMPCQLPGEVFNNLKPALYEALKLYHATILAAQSPADSGEVKPTDTERIHGIKIVKVKP